MGALGEVAGGQEREKKQREGKALGEGRGQGRSPPAAGGPTSEARGFRRSRMGLRPVWRPRSGRGGAGESRVFCDFGDVFWVCGGGGERGLVRAGV